MSEDLIRKIRALLATAESLAEGGNEEAAGAYVAKAHALQQKHSIDLALHEQETGAKPGAVVTRTWPIPNPYGRRKVDLAHAVARRTGCTGYFETDAAAGLYRFTVFGFPADVEWAETLTFSLCHQAEAALRAACPQKASWEHGRSFATSFLAGFTATIDQRLKAAAEEAAAAAQQEPATGSSVALVLAGKAERVKAEMRARAPRLRTVHSDGGRSASGYDQGRHAGRAAHLSRGSVHHGARAGLGR